MFKVSFEGRVGHFQIIFVCIAGGGLAIGVNGNVEGIRVNVDNSSISFED